MINVPSIRQNRAGESGNPVAAAIVVTLVAFHAIANFADGQPLYPPMSPPLHTIIEPSTARAVIVLPPEPTSVHRLAAAELQLYLRRISDVEVPIAANNTAPEDGFRLLIGREHPEASGQVPDGLMEEGFRLKTGDRYLLFTGQNDLGTLWAVYAFLEQHLGVRWFISV